MPSLAQLERALESLAPAQVAVVEAFLKPSVRNARRRAARNAMFRAVAVFHYPGHATGRELAKALHRDLCCYAASGWRFKRGREPAGDAKRRALHRILSLTDGEVIGWERIRDILAGRP